MDLFHPALTPFTIALILMGAIALMEILGALFGAGLSDMVEGFVPDFDIDGPDMDGPDAPDAPGIGPFSQLLAWLSVGKVPVLVLLIAFLTGFGLAGLILQETFKGVTTIYLHGAIASVPAFLVALPVTRYLGLGLSRLMPQEETDAVSSDTFIGKVATIIRGEARIGAPAEAKLKDFTGKVHYVLVEPDADNKNFAQGSEVILVEKNGAVFRGIENTNPALSPE